MLLVAPSVSQDRHITHTHEVHAYELNAMIKMLSYILFGVLHYYVVLVVVSIHKFSKYVLIPTHRILAKVLQ